MTIKTEYVIDEKGHKKSIVLSIEDYIKLWEHLEDLEDALELKKSKETAKEFIDFDTLARRLRKQGRIS